MRCRGKKIIYSKKEHTHTYYMEIQCKNTAIQAYSTRCKYTYVDKGDKVHLVYNAYSTFLLVYVQ
jgi:hypothetical protein